MMGREQEIQRYGFLASNRARTAAEDAEVYELQRRLEDVTGWPVLPRQEIPDEALTVFNLRPSGVVDEYRTLVRKMVRGAGLSFEEQGRLTFLENQYGLTPRELKP